MGQNASNNSLDFSDNHNRLNRFELGEAKNKLENLETGQKHITTELKEINLGLKSLYTTTYTKQDAEKDFAIRDRLWETRYQILEKEQSK